MKIIAVSGVARAGKDTIANGLQKVIMEMNPSIKILRTSFASHLKSEVREFIQEKFDIDPYLADGEEKEIIRPILIGHGQARRAQTKGKYWIDKVERDILFSKPDLTIISDLRFADETDDELSWLKKINGKLIHVSRYNIENGKKKFTPPAGADEKRNDPKLKSAADYSISWKGSEDIKELEEMTRSFCEEFYYKNISYIQ
jgi:hypothetical protein